MLCCLRWKFSTSALEIQSKLFPKAYSALLLPGQSLGRGHLRANLDLLGTCVGTAPGKRKSRSVDTALPRCVLELETRRKGHLVAWAGTGMCTGDNYASSVRAIEIDKHGKDSRRER